nr:GDSL esterase/lipase [Ipomoea batatas]
MGKWCCLWVHFFFLLWCTVQAWSQQRDPSQVPCFFIFGDSLVDNGNNNGILTLARANYMPYGVDFPSGTTGRFTNGRTFVDILAQLLGFDSYIPPFGRVRGRELLRGVNYASGAAGIRDETGNNLAYAAALLKDYLQQLTNLHGLGARKIVVTSVGQIGCIPYELARYNGNDSKCNEEINNAITIFNTGLKRLVDQFNKGQLPGSKFVYLDSFASSKDLVANARRYGFEVVDKGCCGVGKNNGQITCLPLQQPCDDRSKYIFWDAFHPTEVANILLAKKAFSSTSKVFAYPINIQQLAMM